MPAKLLDGKAIADTIRTQLKHEIKQFHAEKRFPPGLAVILVGDNPASKIYVSSKRKACAAIGIRSFEFDLPEETNEQQLITLIHDLNNNPEIHGILIQLPLPQHITVQTVVEAVDPKKDVDGFHPYNLGRLAQLQPTVRSSTPFGIIQLLEHYQLNLDGLDAVMVGASNIVGKPMLFELLKKNCTVTLCHSKTKDLVKYIKNADLLIVAIGNPSVIKTEWLKPGVIIVDVGMNRLDHNKVCGDVDFAAASQIASWITPVPGGVGPMTVTALLQNTLSAYKNQLGL